MDARSTFQLPRGRNSQVIQQMIDPVVGNPQASGLIWLSRYNQISVRNRKAATGAEVCPSDNLVGLTSVRFHMHVRIRTRDGVNLH